MIDLVPTHVFRLMKVVNRVTYSWGNSLEDRSHDKQYSQEFKNLYVQILLGDNSPGISHVFVCHLRKVVTDLYSELSF